MRRGFTLIELLVVVAIIGLLASIVMASLNTARSKGEDAAILSELNQLVILAELNYSDYGSYANLQKGWVTNTYSCASIPFAGTYANQAKAICRSIIANTGTVCGTNAYCFYSGITSAAPYSSNYAKHYSFMVYLPGATAQAGGVAQYACAGSSGGRYVGPQGTWTGTGCYANP